MNISPYAIPGVVVDINFEFIKFTVCDYLKITPNNIDSPNRNPRVMEARKFIWHLTRYYCKKKYSFHALGKLTNRSHASVIVGIKSIQNLIAIERRLKNYDKDLKQIINNLQDKKK